MAPKKNDEGGDEKGKKKEKGEKAKTKSPAEFFSENKNIAGFDNPGKSLYTTIRELVENSLDACESISELPDIEISIQELDGAELNRTLGLVQHDRLDASLFEKAAKGGPKSKAAQAKAAAAAAAAAGDDDDDAPAAAGRRPQREEGRRGLLLPRRRSRQWLRYEARADPRDAWPRAMAHGVRQTRGKLARREDGPHLE